MNKLKSIWRAFLQYFFPSYYLKFQDNYNKDVLDQVNYAEIKMESGVINPEDLFKDTDFVAIDQKIKSNKIRVL